MAQRQWKKRRWLGIALLLVAVLLLGLGETALKGRLAPGIYVLYWTACLFALGLAVLVALFDIRAVARDARREQRELLKKIIEDLPLNPPLRKPPPPEPGENQEE